MVEGFVATLSGLSLVESIVVVFSIIVLLKILIILFKPQWWSKLFDKMIGKKWITYIYLYLFLYFSYLLVRRIAIVDFAFATFTFTLFFGYIAMYFPVVAKRWKNSVLKSRKNLWQVYAIFIIIAFWALKVTLF